MKRRWPRQIDGMAALSRPGAAIEAPGRRRAVERSPLDAEARRLESGHDIVDRFGVARLAFDLDHRVLRRKPGEDPAVVDLNHVDAGFVDLGGDRCERARLVVSRDMEPRDTALADEV